MIPKGLANGGVLEWRSIVNSLQVLRLKDLGPVVTSACDGQDSGDKPKHLHLFAKEMKPTIRAMRVREAKDFLVRQTAEQAALEGAPLSDLEKRMMYFTESPDAVEDAVKLHEEFEAQYDSEEYESKIAKLLHHAHIRVKKESGDARARWDDAIKCLRRGDHYLLVMWDLAPSDERPRGDSLKLLAAGLGVAALVSMVVFFASRLEPQWRWLQKKIPYPNSHVMFGIFVTIVLAIFFFPRRAGNAVEWLLDQTLFRFLGPKKDGKDL